MVATLHHNPVARITNFYESSFRQLSDIQQKQTGLLIGAAVADAAAHAFEGCTVEEIAAFAADQAKAQGDVMAEEDPLVFAQAGPRRDGRRGHPLGPLRHHSYTHLFASQLLRVMASSRGEFPVSYVKDEWVSAARTHPDCFANEHASLLHVLGVVLPLPVIYPWADDATLRAYATPFIDFLTEPPAGNFGVDSRNAVRDYTLSALGVALRCLQSIPDPYRNAAFMAVPGTADIFPEDVASFCPARAHDNALPNAAPIFPCGGGGSGSNSCVLPARALVQDVRVVREGLVVARGARTFPDGVKAAIRLGGPVCQRSIIVGALLGARMGVRRIPPNWLNATPDYSPLVTRAVEVAQWSWNPPHH
ncbi:hypothetical protein DQ04_01711040 [Trypanosoma grayi]|uniref:hypothetical protein n=1 Tax=Trypanosoma grayi TaxID=71804 RepID=UPI0004F43883|nr:hypothetical protein DQ04_01711040 [Trypanosoma grayi]KEG12441.1 hypothetical protein DQ04_01711040 [Trypanosoma grayi]